MYCVLCTSCVGCTKSALKEAESKLHSSDDTTLQNSFVTDKDLRGRNVLHVNYCPATCLLKNQSLSL